MLGWARATPRVRSSRRNSCHKWLLAAALSRSGQWILSCGEGQEYFFAAGQALMLVPRKQRAVHNPPDKIREAIVLPLQPDAIEKVAFWETACINRGIHVRVFSDYRGALNWLVQDLSTVSSGLQKERKHG